MSDIPEEVERFREWLESLPTDDDRTEALRQVDVCIHCGRSGLPCYCTWDD